MAREIPPGLMRSGTMSTELIGLVISLLGAIVFITAAVGIPAVALVCVRYLKSRERELALEIEYRQKSAQQDLAIEQRLRRIEDALNLDHSSEPFEAPASPEGQPLAAPTPSRIQVR